MRYWLYSHSDPVHTDNYVVAVREAVKIIKALKDSGLGYSVWWCKIRDLEQDRECIIYAGRDFKFHKSRWRQILI